MKKYSLFLAVLFVLMLSCSAFAADGEWTAWDADLTDAAEIACELVEPNSVNAENEAILGEITEDDWAIGPEDAPMTLIEYADFQCPYCSYAGLVALEFQASHPDEVRYVYRHFPLSFHEKAPMAAYAADAAGKQGFFFNAEEWLYETQNDWSGLATLDEFDAWLRENVQTAIEGLDYDQWTADYESDAVREVVDASFEKVARTGAVSGTPTFFANFFPVSYDPAVLEQYLSLFKSFRAYRTSCPVVAVEEGKEYRAVLHTSAGDMVIDLYANAAPNLVSSFMLLAKDGFYDGCSFHNVIADFAVQTGDPSGTGAGLAGYYLPDEGAVDGEFAQAGTVAMANNGANRNSSQFFITQDLFEYYRGVAESQNPDLTADELDAKAQAKVDAMAAKYSAIGQITEDTLDILPLLTTDDVIESIDIEVRILE